MVPDGSSKPPGSIALTALPSSCLPCAIRSSARRPSAQRDPGGGLAGAPSGRNRQGGGAFNAGRRAPARRRSSRARGAGSGAGAARGRTWFRVRVRAGVRVRLRVRVQVGVQVVRGGGAARGRTARRRAAGVAPRAGRAHAAGPCRRRPLAPRLRRSGARTRGQRRQGASAGLGCEPQIGRPPLSAKMRSLPVEDGPSSSLGRPEAGSWGHGRLPRCSGCARGYAGAAWAFGGSRRAEGAVSLDGGGRPLSPCCAASRRGSPRAARAPAADAAPNCSGRRPRCPTARRRRRRERGPSGRA